MNLKQRQIDLIIRIAGVTNECILEQLREEFEEIDEELKKLDKQYLHDIFVEMVDDHKWYYNRMYEDCELSDLINIDLTKYRMKIPKITDRRGLMELSRLMNKKIIILDLESIEIDSIGRGDDFKIYIRSFSRFNDINYQLVRIRV